AQLTIAHVQVEVAQRFHTAKARRKALAQPADADLHGWSPCTAVRRGTPPAGRLARSRRSGISGPGPAQVRGPMLREARVRMRPNPNLARMAIIADDLAGALDAAARFQGAHDVIVLLDADDAARIDAQVVAIDVASRGAAADTARAMMLGAAARLRSEP